MAVSASVAGAGIWALVATLWTARQERRGKLAGQWYQIVYTSTDTDMTGSPHHIDLVACRHRASTASVSSTVWRVWASTVSPPEPREWRAVGRYADGILDVIYWPTAGEGSRGSIHLWYVRDSRYRGHYVRTMVETEDKRLVAAELEKIPLEWVRVGESSEIRATRWLGASSQTVSHLPRSLRRTLRKVTDQPHDSSKAAPKRERQLKDGG